VNCPKCRTENLADSLFCEECSAPLEAACPSCGAGNRPAAKFCRKCRAQMARLAPSSIASPQLPVLSPLSYTPKHLADKILTSRSALEGERKQVTVLFADVKGSMDLAGKLDPEEWHKVMDGFFAILAKGVHRFEGTVNQYTGDGIMALFGAPIAHEDHARRACYAALHLSEELRPYANQLRLRQGLNFSVRMGINSGEVIVGRIGDDLRMDYTAQGHTVGLAARMEQIAEAGKVYLTEHAAALVEGFFQLGDLGQMEVKGVAEPLRVYELQGVGQMRTRLDISRSRGFSRFVGRAEEMQVLESALARAQQGQPQIVGIVGEAGLGKSRLCAEFLERCRASGIMTYEATGVSHGKAIPFLPILQLCRAFFGIGEQDSDTTARERIAGRLLLLDESFRESLPLMFDFLGVPDPELPAPRMDPEARQRQIFAVFRGVIQARGQRETSVTLLEDLHWFDGGSEAFLEPLLDARPGNRGLIMINFRPEYHADWARKSYYQQVALQPLGPDALRQLLADLLGSDASISGLAEAVHARTAGNPFFTEEVIQTLIESGKLVGTKGSYRLVAPIDKLEVPGTVQALLAARIDRLPEREKQVLQTAAVIGKTFHEPILRSVTALTDAALAEALHALKSAEFIYEQALYPVAKYAFKHPLTQEVALGSQLQERRGRTHATVARAIEAAHVEKLDEQAALLAHHWNEAGEALAAARWHRRAADWLWMRDVARSFEHFARVRTLTAALLDDAEGREHGLRARIMLLQASWRVGLSPGEIEPLAAEARQIAAHQGDARSRLDIESALMPAYWLTGQLAKAAEIGAEAVRLADEVGDVSFRALVRADLGHIYVSSGRLADALRVFDEGLDVGGDDPNLGLDRMGFSTQVWTRSRHGWALVEMGRLAPGVADLEAAVRRLRDLGQWEFASLTLLFRVFADEYAGDPVDAGLRHARESLEYGERAGSPFAQSFGYHALGRVRLAAKDSPAALEALEQAQALPLSADFEPVHLAFLAEARLGVGDAEGARATADQAIRLAQERGTRGWEVRAHLAQARVLRALDGVAAKAAIEACLVRAEALVAETGARAQTPFLIEERARLALDLGDARDGACLLREAQRAFAEMGAAGHAARLAAVLAAGEDE